MTTDPKAPLPDAERLIRSLKNCAYSHGQTDSIEYASAKRYGLAQEKSEAAADALRSHIAALEAENKRMLDGLQHYATMDGAAGHMARAIIAQTGKETE